MLDNLFDINELFRRAVKYIVEGIMVGLAASLIPQKPLKFDETCTSPPDNKRSPVA